MESSVSSSESSYQLKNTTAEFEEDNKFNKNEELKHPNLDELSGEAVETNILNEEVTVNVKFVPIAVSEAINHFKNREFPLTHTNGMSDKRTFDLFRWLKSSPKLNDNLTSELNLVQSIMECRLDWDDPIQWRMLQTIYLSFTQTDNPCPKKGSHWQKIGFQGNDPTTDLRRVGLFGVLQLLHLTSPDLLNFSHLLHSVANSDVQPFPMAVLSLNATNITFNAIDSGKLVRECNSRNSVIEVLNMFYVAVLVYILKVWILEKKTIKDSGYLLKDAERYCCKNVKKALKDLPVELNKLLT